MKEKEIQNTAMNTAPPKELREIQQHLTLRYPIEVVEDEDGVVASIPDLPGCVSYGETIPQAVENLNSTKELWIKGRLESGQPVPTPSQVEDFSGKFVLRVPRGLHRSLDREARKQGVSLNQYILHLLSERHALTKLEGFISQMPAPLALPNAARHWDADWPEGRIHTCHLFVHSGTTKPENPLLSMIDFVRKPPKQFRRLVKRTELAAAFEIKP